VVRFTAAFFVNFIVTVFVPDSAVAAQIFPLKILTGAPQQWRAEGGQTGRRPRASKAGGHPKREIKKV